MEARADHTSKMGHARIDLWDTSGIYQLAALPAESVSERPQSGADALAAGHNAVDGGMLPLLHCGPSPCVWNRRLDCMWVGVLTHAPRHVCVQLHTAVAGRDYERCCMILGDLEGELDNMSSVQNPLSARDHVCPTPFPPFSQSAHTDTAHCLSLPPESYRSDELTALLHDPRACHTG